MNSKKVYLVQTNTTVGFLSQDLERLNQIKKRPKNKKFLKVVTSFSSLPRVPKKFRHKVRKAVDTNTFVYSHKNEAIRVIKEKRHKNFIDKFGWMYSTSANESGKNFDKEFAIKNADILVMDERGYFEGKPSNIYKINKTKIKKLR